MLDVLGKVQLKGTVKDIRQLIKDGEQADDDEENESKFKQDLNNINSHLDINLYYDGGSKAQGTFVLEPMEDYGEWYMDPAISFPDGSVYSIENFFNKDDFKDLIETAEKLMEDFYGLLGEEEVEPEPIAGPIED